VQLDPDDIEQIASQVADLLRSEHPPRSGRYVDAATLADELGVDRDWVYAHARQLGAIRLGGPRGRLRFDRQQAIDALGGKQNAPPKRRRPAKRQHTRRSTTSPANLIPYEG
jgi:hypothetical protein